MGGVNVDSRGSGGRRSLDSEINMIPMIDLLMVTISFLLITAVWSHMSRLNADAQVPGQAKDEPLTPVVPEKQLHITMHGQDEFVLAWKQGAAVISSSLVSRREQKTTEGTVHVVRFPDLADRVAQEWTRTDGMHRDPADTKLDQVVLHTDNETPYGEMVGVIDAVYGVHRSVKVGSKTKSESAFNMTFSVN